MGTVKGQIRVRGTCKNGHVTEATSDKGRVTWNGTCAHDGCDLKVTARRIPGAQAAKKPAKKAAEAPPGQRADHQVTEVEYDVDDPDPGPGTDDGGAGGGGDPAPAGEGDPTPVPAPEPERPAEQPRRADGRWRGRRRRLSRSERAAARERADQDWRIPNVLPR